jgi:hypothetical protein
MKSMRKTFQLAALLSLVFIFGCSTTVSKKSKISSSGKTSEILVVINDVHWESSLGDTLRWFFGQSYPANNVEEPIFDLAHIPHKALNDMFKTHRNILLIDIDEKYTRPKLEARMDVWSQPQAVIKIQSPDRNGIIEEFLSKKNNIAAIFEDMEHARIVKAYKSVPNYKVIQEIKKKFGIYLPLPDAFENAIEKENFMWVRKVTTKYDHNIMIYIEPYTDTSAFSLDHILKRRNSITRQYIHTQLDSTWMKVSEIYPPDYKKVDFKGNYAVEVRGLWDVENDFMGGPFISYTILDQERNLLITLDGAVYFPNKEKRDQIRQLEAVFKGMEYSYKEKRNNDTVQ